MQFFRRNCARSEINDFADADFVCRIKGAGADVGKVIFAVAHEVVLDWGAPVVSIEPLLTLTTLFGLKVCPLEHGVSS